MSEVCRGEEDEGEGGGPLRMEEGGKEGGVSENGRKGGGREREDGVEN